jgi:hypothetical protein
LLEEPLSKGVAAAAFSQLAMLFVHIAVSTRFAVSGRRESPHWFARVIYANDYGRPYAEGSNLIVGVKSFL